MTQKSFHWNGASIGDADALTVSASDGIGYRLSNEDYESPFVDIGLRMLFNGDENRGVLKGWLNELAVTGAASPVSVNTGGAIIYGMPYRNTAAVNVVVPAPTTDTRQDRIVLRRDWSAQTVRITRIAGVEGGGVPAMTQSPAPTGTGVYDIPLANLSVTTIGGITVTDTREFCLFGTDIGTGALDTTQLSNDSVDWADRATRTKRIFVGGGDLEPALNAGRFSYSQASNVLMTGTPGWNGGANEEGWQLTGSAYEGVYTTLWLPLADYASGDITTNIWWVDNAGIAVTFYIRSGYQRYTTGSLLYNGYNTEYITTGGAVSDVFKTEGITIPAAHISTSLNPHFFHYMAWWYNAAGAEDISILGIEFEYLGYT